MMIDISEGIDINKTSKSKEYDTCHYWHILNKGFHFQSNFSNRFHDLDAITYNASKSKRLC